MEFLYPVFTKIEPNGRYKDITGETSFNSCMKGFEYVIRDKIRKSTSDFKLSGKTNIDYKKYVEIQSLMYLIRYLKYITNRASHYNKEYENEEENPYLSLGNLITVYETSKIWLEESNKEIE